MPETAGGWSDSVEISLDDSGEYAVPVDERRDSLDDDAFFASLREAVRDDTPLSAREPAEQYVEGGDQPDDQRKLFRRRR